MISKQALGNILFGMADDLRDKVEDYKSYILTLLFFKRLSDNYEWETQNKIDEFVKQYGKQPNTRQIEKIVKDAHDFKIPEGCFWYDTIGCSYETKELSGAIARQKETCHLIGG